MPYVLIGIAILILLGIIFIAIYNRLQQLQIKIEEAGSGIDIALEKRYDLLSEQLAVVKKYLSHEYDTLTDVTALRSGTAGEERRLDLQQELSTEAVRSIDAEISRQSRSMEEIRHQLDRSRFSRPNAGKHGAQNHARQEQNNLSQVTGFRQNAFNQKIRTLADAHRSLSGIAAGIDALCEQYPLPNCWISIDQFQRTISNTEEYLQAARRLYNSNVSLYNQTVRTIPWSIVASLFHMEEASFYEAEEHKRSFQVSFD